MTAADVVVLNPSGLRAALEARIGELSDRLHRLMTERAILQGELRFPRGGKSAAEVQAALIAHGVELRGESATPD